jgi:hypothetical protein
LGAGRSFEAQYTFKGPTPAGEYDVVIKGITADGTANLSADVLWRVAGQPDQLLGTLDGTPQPPSIHAVPYIMSGFDVPALDSKPGDALILRVSYTAGTKIFNAVETSMTIP